MPEKMNDTNQFYARLTPFYHLIYPNWEASMQRQAGMLDSVIRELWGDISTILDVSCGIGTQAIGLAQFGYSVTASDLSPEEIERAKQEATTRNLSVAFSVADMRSAHDHHATEFDLVLSADNSVPHLLSDNDILTAFRQFHACARPGGGCIVTVRDYEKEDLSKQQVKPYGIQEEDGVRWLSWQVWDPHLPTYDVTMYFVEDRRESECKTHVMRSTYYAIGIPRLMELMTEAGFVDVKRLDGRFFQPIIMGTRRAQPAQACDGLKPALAAQRSAKKGKDHTRCNWDLQIVRQRRLPRLCRRSGQRIGLSRDLRRVGNQYDCPNRSQHSIHDQEQELGSQHEEEHLCGGNVPLRKRTRVLHHGHTPPS